MSIVAYHRPTHLDEALPLLGTDGTVVLAGGTDLVPLVRGGLAALRTLVDVRRLPGLGDVTWDADGGVRIGAAVTLAQLARDPQVRARLPLLADACAAAGSAALRAMGTLGGNLCQRPRCSYLRHGAACHRAGGTGCPARDGVPHLHAIIGHGPCVAVHPSDPAVALAALEATVHVAGAGGTRTVPLDAFLAPAAAGGPQDVALAPGELVTAIAVDATATGGVQHFEKVLQRGAWDFALAAVAAHRRRDGEVRLVLGGVAPRPWRVIDSIEEDVASGGLSDDDVETLAARALYDARPLPGTAYKVAIAEAILRRAIAALVAAR